MDTDAFIRRFKEILEDNNFTASALADELEIQRSSISHLLSGRNKPSLDFVLKLLKKFPEINMYWLLNGTEPKFKADKKPLKDKTIVQTPPRTVENNDIPIEVAAFSNQNKKIKHIVIFYEDATFESYTPN